MWYVGIDLGWEKTMVALEDETGGKIGPRQFSNRHSEKLVEYVCRYKPFKAVIESSGSHRWIYKMLSKHGEVVLAHPKRLNAIWSARAKTDKRDAQALAMLLRAGLIPPAHMPLERYQFLRDLTRSRAKLVDACTDAKNQIHFLLARENIHPAMKCIFKKHGIEWLRSVEMDPVATAMRDELLERIEHYKVSLAAVDEHLEKIAPEYPEAKALTCLHGVGLYTALMIIGEYADPERFGSAEQAGAYTGLTPRVNQSGKHCYYGNICREGSKWLRWILVEAGIHMVRRDEKLQLFYERIRRRSGKMIARVAVGRKLGEICWKRLRHWQRTGEVLCYQAQSN